MTDKVDDERDAYMGNITLTSEQFLQDGEIPISAAHVAVGGQNLSPQLSWSEVPPGTRSLAITCWDPDAPTTVGFSHWVRFDIPASMTQLAQGTGTQLGEWIDGFSDWGESHYGGMAPPKGDHPHQYQFTIYALDVESLGLDDKTTYAKFRFIIRDHVMTTGSLVGRFGIA
jgi:hypothetical protein